MITEYFFEIISENLTFHLKLLRASSYNTTRLYQLLNTTTDIPREGCDKGMSQVE